jgi:starvation-inducible DNA-binding protein
MFGVQYTEMWNAMDEIAERIRTLGAYAPNTYAEMIKCANLKETSQTPDADSMVDILANDNSAIVETLYKALRAAQDAGDEGTTDMMIGRSQIHEKNAWMLRSHLKS